MAKAAAILLFLVIVAAALLSSHQHRPFELQIDANPGAWPENAEAAQGGFVPEQICMVVMRPTGEKVRRISRT